LFWGTYQELQEKYPYYSILKIPNGANLSAMGPDMQNYKFINHLDEGHDGIAVKNGPADILLDYMANPILILYSAGLNPPRDILILVSRYHTI
jgi:hypothetical protein